MASSLHEDPEMPTPPGRPQSAPTAEARPLTGRERRRQLRVDTLGQIEVRSIHTPQPLSLRELSYGGLSLEATAPFAVGSLHEFRLAFDGQSPSVVVTARTRHCTLQSTSTGLAIYLVGFEFVHPTDAVRRDLTALVDHAQTLWSDA